MGKEWYVVHTYSGHEKKVKTNLERRLKALGIEDKVSQIIIPTEEVSETKSGKKKTISRRFLPGYILIEMEMNDDTWHAVRHTPGVFGFIGEYNNPTPLPKEDVENIINQIEGKKPPITRTIFKKGEAVRVTQGPFIDFEGTVGEVDDKHGRLKVMINILGRSTPVELEVHQVEKI